MVEKLTDVTYRLLIGGEFREATSGQTFETFNPATGEKLADVPLAGREDVDAAVQAAKRAFPEWCERSPMERGRFLHRLAARLRERAQEYAMLDALDGGNPVKSMLFDVEMAAQTLEYFAGLAPEVKGETIPTTAGMLNLTRREPYGVVGRIIPFNHPILFAASRIAAPLAAGNTVVLKPAEQTPLSALEFAKDVAEIFPPGVVNIVTGDGPTTGAALVEHPEVRRIAFTGSVETGRIIMRAAAEQLKVLSLELGGKNPIIIFPDAEIEAATEAIVTGMNFMWCQGQSCGSTSRLFVHESLYEPVVERVIERVRKIRIGLPTEDDAEMGCLVSEEQYQKVMGYIELGKSAGFRVLWGGGKPEGEKFQRGYFVAPTIFGDVDARSRLAQEEIFGPVLSVIRWNRYEEMIEAVNSVQYGLTASIWTRNFSQAERAARDVQAGYVWINDSSRHYIGVPFGGYKQSGIGREESLDELLGYTQLKAVNINLTKGW
jgi:betaine-aldehyde dehydrogenase